MIISMRRMSIYGGMIGGVKVIICDKNLANQARNNSLNYQFYMTNPGQVQDFNHGRVFISSYVE